MRSRASSSAIREGDSGASAIVKSVPATVGLLLGVASTTVGIGPVLPVLPIRPWHACVVVALVVAVATAGTRGVTRPRVLASDVGLVALVGVCVVIEQVNSWGLAIPADFGSAVYPAYFLVGYAATRLTVRDDDDAGRFLTPFVLPVVIAAAVSVGQLRSREFAERVLAIAPSEGLTQRLGEDTELRATALIGHWTGAGMYFCAMVTACVCALLLGQTTGRRGALVWVALVAGVVGSYAAATLSVLATAVAVLVVTVVVGTTRVRVLVVAAGMVSGAIAYVVAGRALDARVNEQIDPSRTRPTGPGTPPPPPDTSWIPSTLSYRWRIWTEQTVPAIVERPLTGWGGAVFDSPATPDFVRWRSAESQWLATALSFGIPAALVVVALLVSIGLLLRARSRIRAPMIALFAMSVLTAFTVPVFTNRGLPVPFWILLGLVAAGRASPVRRRSVKPELSSE